MFKDGGFLRFPEGEGGADAGAISGPSGDAQAASGETDPRFSDPAVAKHVQDRIAQELRHIPNEHRSPDGFKKLADRARQFDALQADPRWNAFLAAQGRNGDRPQKTVSEAMLERLTGKYGKFSEQQAGIMGDIASFLEEHFSQNLIPQYIERQTQPMQQAFYQDKVNAELAAARALPDFAKYESEIHAKIEEYEGRIGYEDAYHAVMNRHRKEIDAAAAEAEERQESGRRAGKQTEKPTGHGSKDVETRRPGTRKEAIKTAATRLRAQGIPVD